MTQADIASTPQHRLEDVECAICHSGLEDPRFLSCHDFFCINCIRFLAKGSAFECPLCHSQISLSEGEVEKLPPAIAFKRIRERLGKTLSNSSRPTKRFPPPSTRDQHDFVCQEHDIPLKLFCVDCDTRICPECALGPRHAKHRYDYAVRPDGTYWGSLAEKELDQLWKEVRSAVENVDRRKKGYVERGVVFANRLNDAFDEIVAVMEQKRDEMLQRLSAVMQEGLHSFGQQEEMLKKMDAKMCDPNFAGDRSPTVQILHEADRKAYLAQAREKYVAAASVTLPEDVPLPFQAQCMQEICRLKMAAFDSPPTAHIAAPSPNTTESAPLTRESHSTDDDVTAATAPADSESKHPLALKPLATAATNGGGSKFPTPLGYATRAITGLGKLCAIAIGTKGQIAVAEAHPRNLVRICDQGGKEVIRMKGKRLNLPGALVLDLDGCVYMSEREGHCVNKFDAEGKLIKTTRGSKAVKLWYPRGVELVDDRLYVCDGGNNQIKILDKELNFVDSFSAFVSPSPQHVCASSSGLVYVTSAVTPGIQVFTKDSHKFIRTIAAYSSYGPICFDKGRDILYVVDSKGSSVHHLRPDGTALGRYALNGDDVVNCSGVAVDPDGHVYMCVDTRILVFTLQA